MFHLKQWMGIYLLCMISTICQSHINDHLLYYETLHHSQLSHHHISRRSVTDERAMFEKILKFSTLGRDFNLHLFPRRGLLTSDFKAYTVNGRGEMKTFVVDRDNFMEGYVDGKKNSSSVFLHFEHGNIVATIKTTEDTFTIEPSWRHLSKSENHSMISYRASDMKKKIRNDESESQSYCGFVHANHDDAEFKPPINDLFVNDGQTSRSQKKSQHHRSRRATIDKTTCTVLAVADYHFFRDIGMGEVSIAANYLIGELSRVDALYRKTNFEGYTNLGLELQKLKIYEEPTVSSGVHYNMETDVWDTSDLLTAFSRDSDLDDYCLGHLWTSIIFSDGVLGLGWIASPNANYAGGICSPSYGGFKNNTAWSTAVDKYGDRVLTQQADLVTAHEFGHNWGSNHDPASDSCAPSSLDGGSYLMYTYSVSGYDTNNDEFSSCSTLSIKAVLDSKLENCFQAASENYCGNMALEEPYEECDGGPDMLSGNDPCCDTNCKFRSNAVCSDTNSICCDNCQFASITKLCSEAVTQSNYSCDANSYCSGNGTECQNTYRPDGSSCVDYGSCVGGVCISLCESMNLVSCICTEEENSCLFCCRDSADGLCQPFLDNDGNSLVQPDGRSCTQGICEAGVCEAQIVGLSDRLWDVVNIFSTDAFIEFLRNNLVFCIIVLSLLLYIPICIIIAIVDYRNEKNEKEVLDWHNSENETLYTDKSQGIRQAYRRRQKPKPSNRVGPTSNEGNGSASNIRPASKSSVNVSYTHF